MQIEKNCFLKQTSLRLFYKQHEFSAYKIP